MVCVLPLGVFGRRVILPLVTISACSLSPKFGAGKVVGGPTASVSINSTDGSIAGLKTSSAGFKERWFSGSTAGRPRVQRGGRCWPSPDPAAGGSPHLRQGQGWGGRLPAGPRTCTPAEVGGGRLPAGRRTCAWAAGVPPGRGRVL